MVSMLAPPVDSLASAIRAVTLVRPVNPAMLCLLRCKLVVRLARLVLYEIRSSCRRLWTRKSLALSGGTLRMGTLASSYHPASRVVANT